MIRRSKIGLIIQALVSCVALAVWVCPPADAAWRDTAAEASRAERDQEVEKSIELWENALAQAEAMGSDHPCVSISLRNLGSLYSHTKFSGRYLPKSRACFLRVVEDFESLGETFTDLWFPLVGLARIAAVEGKWNESTRLLERARELCLRHAMDKTSLADVYAFLLVPYQARNEKEKSADALTRFEAVLKDGAPPPAELSRRMSVYSYVLRLWGDAGNNPAPFDKAAVLVATRSVNLLLETVPDRNVHLLKASDVIQLALSYNELVSGLTDAGRFAEARESRQASTDVLQIVADRPDVSCETLEYAAKLYRAYCGRNLVRKKKTTTP